MKNKVISGLISLLCISFILSSCNMSAVSQLLGDKNVSPLPEKTTTGGVISLPEETTTGGVITLPDAAVSEAAGSDTGDDDIYNIENLTLREKVGQLFIVRPEVLDSTLTEATAVTDNMRQFMEKYPVGGVAMFAINITGASQITTFNTELQNESRIPLFIAIDEEGGNVARLANKSVLNLKKYESAAAVGASGNPADGLEMGNTIGSYLRSFGFNMNFAPVADVNTNPNNTVIGKRAFSSDPVIASEMALSFAQGLKNNQVTPVFKHFPGHGDTNEDSHSLLAVNNKTLEEMEACEWLAYKNLTKDDCVMVGHIATPNLTGNNTPATVSYQLVTDYLRNYLGFEGLIITDSLLMGAVTNSYTSAEVCIGAVKAGCDILLDPASFTDAFEAIVKAVENGEISEERLDESVKRILEFKKARHNALVSVG